MNKTVVIHQPDFLPYLGFFHRFLHANFWVILDDAQFVQHSSRSWHNRDKIKTPQGEKWITLSVQKCRIGTPIKEVRLSQEVKWREDHINLIKTNYKNAGYFNEIFPYLEELYLFEYDKMIDFNLKSIEMLMKLFDIEIPCIKSSTLEASGKKGDLLIDILKKVSGTTYLSGVGARAYTDEKLFKNAGIRLIWQDFKHPTYPQLHGDFIPYLSSIDLLLNCGIKKSGEILRGC